MTGGSALRAGLVIAFVLFITLPLVMILLEAFGADWFGVQMLPAQWTLKWFTWAAQTVDLTGVLLNTVEIALLATVFTLVIAIPAAWAIARYGLPLKSVLIGAILFPRMIPEITFALGVARIFYAIHLTNTAVGIALAHVILAAPFAVVVLVSTFEGMDARLLEAGAVLGCGPLSLFRRVTLPLALPGIVAAALFSFLASYNDFVLTLMVYGADTVTLPVQTYLSLGNGYLSVAAAISTILLLPSLLFLLGMLRMVNPENLLGGLKGA
ncbi:MAG TPA: ABC transporter permease subunit [Xanthobacteraceae bacterium]|jgi:putative spermidine/putrescine transport system permease protein|nr:ABC transporter permease subunit [Xanthobacteraceae bacterium]